MKIEAENTLQIKTRMQRALNTMVQDTVKARDKNILAVSSGLSMLMIILYMTDDPKKYKPLENAAAVKISYKNGKYTVNDVGNFNYVTKGKDIINKTQ
ncbi:hypothetical protein M5G07_09995 [Serratia symbiotica]|nr:hypothetical protein [Serratia symbiotica]